MAVGRGGKAAPPWAQRRAWEGGVAGPRALGRACRLAAGPTLSASAFCCFIATSDIFDSSPLLYLNSIMSGFLHISDLLQNYVAFFPVLKFLFDVIIDSKYCSA